jgi:Gram-negative bacterial TonB protein C-terminal
MMTKAGSLLQSLEEPQSASTVTNRLRNSEENGSQLLELRTEAGAVYVCPSRWQRVRLQWTFRHFHVLPPQVLSRRDQRLIEKLSQSAVVTPSLPVASKTVFGVVEKVRSKQPASAPRVVTLRTEAAATPAFLAKAEIAELPSPDLSVVVKQRETREAPGGPKKGGDVPFEQWGALSALAAVGITVILASVYGAPLFSTTGQMRNPRALSTLTKHAAPDLHPTATRPLPVSPATASLPNAEKPKRRVAPPPPEPMVAQQEPAPPPAGGSDESIDAKGGSRSPVPIFDMVPDTIPEPAPVVPSATPERLFVAELPQGHFAHPEVERDLVGELQLKALIGADGSVKEVTVLSGSPKLAQAGIQAVRQWHYSPYQVLGRPVEVETQIKMSFFGQDAVSIASVANGPTSQ